MIFYFFYSAKYLFKQLNLALTHLQQETLKDYFILFVDKPTPNSTQPIKHYFINAK
jgi:hypothetical protein